MWVMTKGFSPVKKGADDKSRFTGFPMAWQSR
jgi:hypothetical protein